MQKELLLKEFDDLKKAIFLLDSSVEKFKPYELGKIYTPQELEYYDSLSFRFEKCVELVLNFYKGLEIILYSKVSDTLRDRLLNMQKIELIDDIDFWIEAGLLRNKIAHSYLPAQLKDIYVEVTRKSRKIFEYVKRTEKYLQDNIK
ncbi:MAG: hypothetical protein ABIH71_00615 [Candidatus Omnitrophota bacterium]|nr:hypothetical protein [Candidatus Omnitrophota bacterium]